MAGHHKSPVGSGGIVIGDKAIAALFGRSPRSLWRWVKHHDFPVATLPSGHICTSLSLIDAWLLGRLKGSGPNRPGTFEARAEAGDEGGDVHASVMPQSRERP